MIHMDSWTCMESEKASTGLEWPPSNSVKWDLCLMEGTSFYQGFNGRFSDTAASINTLTWDLYLLLLNSTDQALAEHKSSFSPLQVLIICAVIAADFLAFSSQPGKVVVAGVGVLFQTSKFRCLLSAHDVGALMTQCWMRLQRMSSPFLYPSA